MHIYCIYDLRLYCIGAETRLSQTWKITFEISGRLAHEATMLFKENQNELF